MPKKKKARKSPTKQRATKKRVITRGKPRKGVPKKVATKRRAKKGATKKRTKKSAMHHLDRAHDSIRKATSSGGKINRAKVKKLRSALDAAELIAKSL